MSQADENKDLSHQIPGESGRGTWGIRKYIWHNRRSTEPVRRCHDKARGWKGRDGQDTDE